MKDDVKSILLAGVGGQGILRASDILCLAFMASGLDVKKSEVHGMAQRGGCVTSPCPLWPESLFADCKKRRCGYSGFF